MSLATYIVSRLLNDFLISMIAVGSSVQILALSSQTEHCSQTINNTRNEVINTIGSVSQQLKMLYNFPCSCGYSSWTRVAYLNMTDPGEQCPQSWMLYNTNGVRGCGRSSVGSRIADSVYYSTNGLTYSKVCGRVIAYQRGVTDAFYAYYRLGQTSIEKPYMDGISVTHGQPLSRRHIWTFTSAIHEKDRLNWETTQCSCTNTNFNWQFQLPQFLGNNYFCDTGSQERNDDRSKLFSGNPLWDGSGCGPTSSCCQFNNPPWFCTTLPEPSSDDIELRLCLSEAYADEDIIVSLVDIYVQ